jgi:hypothetical protein
MKTRLKLRRASWVVGTTLGTISIRQNKGISKEPCFRFVFAKPRSIVVISILDN